MPKNNWRKLKQSGTVQYEVGDEQVGLTLVASRMLDPSDPHPVLIGIWNGNRYNHVRLDNEQLSGLVEILQKMLDT